MNNLINGFLNKQFLTILKLTLFAFLLSACGGGGSSSNDSGDNDDEEQEIVEVAPLTSNTPFIKFQQIKKLVISWEDVSDASFYRLSEDPDGASGFTQISGDIPSGSETFSIEVPLYERINANYLLESCNAGGCTSSSTVSVSESMQEGIGYFKPDNTIDPSNEDKEFGYAVALSADGSTMAISAPNEERGQRSGFSRGVVYIFTKMSDLTWSLADRLLGNVFLNGSPTQSRIFGISLALSADGMTLAVGDTDRRVSEEGGIRSFEFAGQVIIYTKTNEGWEDQGVLIASNASQDDLFGSAVSLSADGNTLAVGAQGEASNPNSLLTISEGQPDSGAAYIFTREDGEWTEQAFLKADNHEEGDRFGVSLSISGDGNTLVVGARDEDSAARGVNTDSDSGLDNSELSSGAAYIFSRDGATWTQQAYLKALNTDGGDNFGGSVSISADGETIAVGAIDESNNIPVGVNNLVSDEPLEESGAVYLFEKIDNSWTAQSYLKASNADVNDHFGRSVALSADGNRLVVGAGDEDSNGVGLASEQNNNNSTSSGAAYVFKRQDNIWAQSAYLKAPNSEEGDYFGDSVAISSDGKTVAIGAYGESGDSSGVGGNQNDNLGVLTVNGAVYLY